MIDPRRLLALFSVLLVLPLPGLSSSQIVAKPDTRSTQNRISNNSLSFETNRGQADKSFDYIARARGYTVALSAAKTVVAFNKSQLPIRFVGANGRAQVKAQNLLPGRINYLHGNNPSHHQTNISAYARVRYSEIYPGVDIVYYGKGSQLEYDFVVAPHASVDQITFNLETVKSSKVQNGELVVSVDNESFSFEKPIIYQEVDGRRVEITGGYVLKGMNTVGFKIGEYDHQRPLVIDPVLRYSSYVGGSGSEWGNYVKVDAAGNVFLTGFTTSPNFVHTDASVPKGGFDVFITKLSPTGSLIFSTFFGGSGSDTGMSLAFHDNNIFVSGLTDSANYPTTSGAYQQTQNSNQTGFITKLNSTGSAILYSTYFGGTGGISNGLRIALDASGDVYLAGSTNSTQLPVTPGAFQAALNPPVAQGSPAWSDAFVARIHPAGGGTADLVYSSYIGGNLDEITPQIALDGSGMVYLAGVTYSTNFPTTANGLQTQPGSTDIQQRINGASDGYLVKLDLTQPGAAALIYSTYIGGTWEDSVHGLALDSARNAYLTGRTTSANFQTTRNALQRQLAGKKDAYVMKLNPARPGTSGLVYSTYLGGSEDENSFGSAIAVDSVGNAYLTGDTRSTNLPVTVGAFQPSIGGISDVFSAPGGDAFIAKLNSAGTALVYFTYLGGGGGDGAGTIAIDANRNAYVSGYTFSDNLPLTAGAMQLQQGGSFDAFLARVENPSSFESSSQSAEFAMSTAVAPPTLPNPIDTAQKFVRQQYIDFLNREPDSAGLSFWTNEITSCGSDAACIEAKRVNVSAAFFFSIEFQQTGYLVDRVYLTAFGRVPKLDEFSPDSRQIGEGVVVNAPGWEQTLANNKDAYLLEMVQRPSFKAAFPASLTAEQFVNQLDANAGTVLNSTEKAALVTALSGSPTDATRASVLGSVAENTTLREREFNKAFVLMQYFGYLQRNPSDPPDGDLSGYNFWLNKLNQFQGNFVNAELVKAFIRSGEYRRRFGQD
jgi:hypothetical protein